jgi:hypothetical protein
MSFVCVGSICIYNSFLTLSPINYLHVISNYLTSKITEYFQSSILYEILNKLKNWALNIIAYINVYCSLEKSSLHKGWVSYTPVYHAQSPASTITSYATLTLFRKQRTSYFLLRLIESEKICCLESLEQPHFKAK